MPPCAAEAVLLDPKIQVVRNLAREYGAHLLAADGMFAELTATTGPEYWAADGMTVLVEQAPSRTAKSIRSPSGGLFTGGRPEPSRGWGRLPGGARCR
ncbi:hypothetical protein GCM10010207_51060 [Streptomyces atratus]|nr:hypothetical protein GCM10010207_51060 [Streptomyces atratus]